MAEYVNKENLIRHIDNRFGEISTPFVLREIKNFPNADVVEVVRCKDCRCWEEDGIDPITNYRCGFCRHYQWQDAEGWDRETNGNDFCSYGERKE